MSTNDVATAPANSRWQAWIFDLDDTLLDTSGELVPSAMLRAFEFLLAQRLLPSLEEGKRRWSYWRTHKSGVHLFRALLDSLEETQQQDMAEQAYRIFRTPQLPESLEPRPGGREILEKASQKFPLFLVTQGDIDTQMQKVERLGIISFFRHVYYIDPFANENKRKAFAAILSHYNLSPQRVLSIGNRLDNEIALSKILGMQTCYVRHGEHRFETPATAEQIPDFEITDLFDLMKILDQNQTPTTEA